ncbi:hypothetical protein NC653_034865 [Populus alba x Populus x berolinensis]|uniref:DUF4283 domain-containing protein n=1 Tax=Populus alba x Populus x berolinensis TaxID=444605 RepID=A0AAD6LP12_9ROSI|nr:hypothetical protein NC653_034865 [Populus alba x Populus x berolinensis]
MTQVPIWLKFPNLPLKCCTMRCLSKLTSVLDKPIQFDKLIFTKERLSYVWVLVEVDLLADLWSYINVVLPNGNPFFQRVIYETLPKFCKHYRVVGHSTRACYKSQVYIRLVEKIGLANVATMKLSPAVDAPTVPTVPSVAQDEQQCNQATSIGSKGWETVRKRKNGNGNKHHSPSSKTLSVSAKGKTPTVIVSINSNKTLQRHASCMLTRSSAQRNSNKSSAIGGVPPPFLINVSLLLDCERA